MTTVFYTKLNIPLPADLFDHCLSQLNSAARNKILRLRQSRDQHASIIGKMLLLKGLIKFGYETGRLKELNYTKYHRPFIDLPIDFNISHSGDLIVCALSDKCKLGIDVEEIRSVDIQDFKNVLSKGEYKSILNVRNPDTEFFNTWTSKEAVVKANGRGLFIPLQDVTLQNNTALLYERTWHLKSIPISGPYSSTIATNHQLLQEEPYLNYISVEEFRV